MAKFTDLSNEVVIAIGSFIRKPTDILHLYIAERRSYGLIGPLLYENIVLHHNDYRSRGEHKRDLIEQGRPLRRLVLKLMEEYKRDYTRGKECRSLAIRTGERLSFALPDVFNIGFYAPFLKNLSLIICVRQDEARFNQELRISAVGVALQDFSPSLETLTLYIGGKDDCSGLDKSISNLHKFKAMKKLCIQSQFLLGWNLDYDLDPFAPPLLSQLLPPNLEDLTIHCCESREYRSNEQEIAHHVEVPLDGKAFATRTLEPSERLAGKYRRVIESVIVCLLKDPELVHGCQVPDCRSSKLRDSFDIVGRRVDSGNVKQL